jgi:hypothetical protein
MSKGSQFEIPVLFLTFNRLDAAKKVFAEIKKSNVSKLYISSDGPRENKPEENEIIEEIRSYILGNIDWECEIFTMFNNTNLGCKTAVSNAINWFFENEEMGIVLEDDCLPSQSFFWFCQEMLNLYMYDDRIFLICGYNHQQTWKPKQNDYFFSLLGGIWGWASWRRAWKHYDLEMSDINTFIESGGFEKVLGDSLGKIKKKMIYEGIIINDVDSWALQWGYARHKNNALTCIPSRSLIENIGFGEDATHTNEVNIRQVKRQELDYDIRINQLVESDVEYDNLMFLKESLFSKILRKIKTASFWK